MKNKIIDAFDSIQPTEQAKKRVFNKIGNRKHKRNPFLRPIFAIATSAAIACLLVFGTMFVPTPMSNNSFALTAYAAEQQPDGTIKAISKLEFNQEDVLKDMIFGVTGDFLNNEAYMYTGIAFGYEGTNIKNVTISVDEGEFGIINESDMHYSIERVGATYTMNKYELTNAHILLWGFDVSGKHIERTVNGAMVDGKVVFDNGRPMFNINIKAIVTFEDGEIQEQSIIYDTDKGILVLSEK